MPTTRYEIRADHPEPNKASEWAVFAIDHGCHSRRVAVTTNHEEAERALLGLRAGPELVAACKSLISAQYNAKGISDYHAALDVAKGAARAAIARAEGGAE